MSDRVPMEEWDIEPVFDSSVYLNRPPVRYEDEDLDGDGSDAPPPDEPRPDDLPSL